MLSDVRYCKECEECYKYTRFERCLFCDDRCQVCTDCMCEYVVDFEYGDNALFFVCDDCVYNPKCRDGERIIRFIKNSKYTNEDIIEKLETEKNVRFGPDAINKRMQREKEKHLYEIEIIQKEIDECTEKLNKLNSNN